MSSSHGPPTARQRPLPVSALCGRGAPGARLSALQTGQVSLQRLQEAARGLRVQRVLEENKLTGLLSAGTQNK